MKNNLLVSTGASMNIIKERFLFMHWQSYTPLCSLFNKTSVSGKISCCSAPLNYSYAIIHNMKNISCQHVIDFKSFAQVKFFLEIEIWSSCLVDQKVWIICSPSLHLKLILGNRILELVLYIAGIVDFSVYEQYK